MRPGLRLLIKFFFLFISFEMSTANANNNRGYSDLFLSVWQTHADTIIQTIDTMNIIAPGATLQLISNQFAFTEGPAANKKGDVYFTDQPNDKIWKYSTEGKLSVFLDKTGRSNGMYFDKKGNLVTCADEKNELWSISPKGKISVLLSGFGGHRFNGPNDLWIHSKGQIYFTDPYYQRPYWDRKSPDIKGQKLYWLPEGKKEAVVADENLVQPNGIIGTPDGKFLYVADIGDGKTYRYSIGEDGSLTDRRLFVEQGSDGMTIDNQGNIYLTGKGVTVYNSKGEKIKHIEVPAKWTANVCFGGKQKNILFITASEFLYTLQMQVKGVN
jgi:gluconolactonase